MTVSDGDSGVFAVLVIMVLIFAAVFGLWAYNDLSGDIQDTRALIDNVNQEIKNLKLMRDG